MPHVIDGDGHISRYLAAQPELNNSLEYNSDSGVLYDASLAGKATALVAGAGMSRAMASKYAQFVGPGMLSALMVAPRAIEHDKNQAPGTSLGSQLTKLSDALGLGNKDTEMAWIGPTKVDIDRSAQIPRYHGVASMLEVDDGLHGRENGAEVSVVLPMKICGALAAMGYDSGSVHKVGRIVRNNMMTVDAPASDKPLAFSAIKAEVENMLTALFKPDEKRVRTVHFNSNEPVLLINDFGRCGGVKLGSIVTEVLEQLQQKYNTWPVRVYAGSFIEGDAADGPEFCVTLLNVQNPDIGGPSMIQLLDHPCNTLGWNGCMRREVWNGRDLLERFEKVEKPEESEKSTSDLAEQFQGTGIAEEDIAEPDVESVATDDVAEDEDQAEAVTDEPNYSYDDPHKDRGSVHHPTWEHSTKSESLIDMISNQASNDGPGAKAGDSSKSLEGSMDKAAEKKRRTESTSSEGFTFL
ncbi:Dihydroxyacetone kinase [Cyphellophora attinorum]|uniref:Dihydroxyacetone kinase n=1 Tax=Cyphellophora attinorum TaxID=1664694 RepID=A0A0N1NZG0_9EURO|nr:Dihydroxyacetone kinase [Phialophora attinorum]KPI38573.1 Dihydroxyacetone kinase [Phialophora attinorum]